MILLRYKKLSILYIIFIVTYLAQLILAPVSRTALEKYHLSTGQARLLALTVALPYIAIWIIALIGYARLATYAKLIQASKDGAAFRIIAWGVLGLALWLPLSTIITNFSEQFYSAHHSATAGLVRLDNYLNLLILSVGFLLVSWGTRKLLETLKKPIFSPSQLVILCYIVFVALYVLLVLHDPARQFPTLGVSAASYYEPDLVLVLTLIIPRLITWYLGIQAVQNIFLYRQRVRGSIYKSALNNLARGLSGVIAVTIALRCLQSLSVTLAHTGLGWLLTLVYVLLILLGVSYWLLARGAQSLQKLEEL